jgi:DNA-binding transcriptional MerR regulator
MNYSVQKLAKLASVSVRTLHYYDEIGLLKPVRLKNGYRQYGENELLRLQQILFFRELDFPLEEIQRIMNSRYFDMSVALHDQRKLLELKKKRLNGLIKTIDKTLTKINLQNNMDDQELYGSFTKDEMDQYAAEAKERWGHTEAYRQSQERTKHFTKDDWKKLKDGMDAFMKKIVATMDKGPKSPEFQKLISEHYNNLRMFYKPNLKMYRGLAEMYVADPRFTAYYENYAPGLAKVMKEAMIAYCDTHEQK